MKKVIKVTAVFLLLILSFLPVYADNDTYVRDDYGLLNQYQIEQLEQYAKTVSEQHNCGVYIRVIGDTWNIESEAENIYANENLGMGTEKNGILMLIAMGDRSIDLMAYGSTANKVFTDYAKDTMREDEIVPYLRYDEWYEGFNAYIQQADYMLTFYESSGTAFDVDTDPAAIAEQEAAEQAARTAKTGITFGAPILTALLTCLGLKSRNKTTGEAHEASTYIPHGGIQMLRQQDVFLYRTEARAPLPSNEGRSHHGGGGTSINSGGFSHSSGHF